jgi:hypothetical protein
MKKIFWLWGCTPRMYRIQSLQEKKHPSQRSPTCDPIQLKSWGACIETLAVSLLRPSSELSNAPTADHQSHVRTTSTVSIYSKRRSINIVMANSTPDIRHEI